MPASGCASVCACFVLIVAAKTGTKPCVFNTNMLQLALEWTAGLVAAPARLSSAAQSTRGVYFSDMSYIIRARRRFHYVKRGTFTCIKREVKCEISSPVLCEITFPDTHAHPYTVLYSSSPPRAYASAHRGQPVRCAPPMQYTRYETTSSLGMRDV